MRSKAVLPALAVVLFLGLGVGLYLFAGARYASTTSGSQPASNCPGYGPLASAGTDVGSPLWYSIDVRVDYGDGEPPRAVTTETVHMPLSEPRAGELLSAPETPAFKNAAYCTLNSFTPVHRYAEVVSPPTVQVVGRDVQVVERLSNTFGRDEVDIGPAVLTTSDTERWSLVVTTPDRLRLVPCHSLSVEAPQTWLSVPTGETPDSMSSSNAVWTNCDAPHSVILTPDTRGRASIAAALRPDTRTLSDVLFWGAQAAVAAIFVVALRRWERTASKPRYEVGRWVLLVPVLALSLLPGVTATLTDLGGAAPTVTRVSTLLAIGCAVVAALIWRLRPYAVLGVAIPSALTGWWLLSHEAANRVGGGTAHAFVGESVLSFLILTLVFSGALNGARLLFSPVRASGRELEAGAWAAGTSLAAIVVYERSSSVLGAALEYFEATPTAPDGGYLYSLIESDPYALLNQASPIIHLLVPVAVVGFILETGGHRLPGRGKSTTVVAGAFLVFYVEIWNAHLWSLWSIPTWLVLGPVTYAALVGRRPDELSAADGGPPGTGSADGMCRSLGEARTNAMVWRSAMQEGRNIERAFSRGDLSFEDYRSRSDSLTALCDRLQARASEPIDPVERLLAERPGTTPVDNARSTARLMGFGAGLVVATLIVYQLLHPFVSGAQLLSTSSTLTFLSTALSQVALWVFGGFAFGLLWRELPGTTGALKAVLPAALVAATPIVDLVIFGVSPHGAVPYSLIIELLSVAAFWAGLTVVGLVMDVRSLRPITRFWSPRREALFATYGLNNLGSKLAFVLAQGAAVVAIAGFVINTVQHPAPASAQVTQMTGTTTSSSTASR